MTVGQLFKNSIEKATFDGDEIDIVKIETFFTVLETIDITGLSDNNKSALVKVLTKDELPAFIQIQDLIIILENFGIKETPADPGSSARLTSKRKRKALDYNELDPNALKIMCLLTDYLLNSDTSVYEYFDGAVYNQIVRTKNKQSTVEIINQVDFFEKLSDETTSMVNYLTDESKSSLTGFLALDSNYPQLLLVKKIIRVLEELSHNTEL